MLLPKVYSIGYSVGSLLQTLISNHTLPDLPSPAETWNFVINVPYWYKEWWLNLVTNDPVHVFVETTLLLSVVYMIIFKNKDWRANRKEHLTELEKEELLLDWRENGRQPLAPHEPLEPRVNDNIVVHGLHGRVLDIEVANSGVRKQVLNFATNDFLAMSSESLASKQDGPAVAIKDASRKALSKYGCGSCGPRGFYGTIDVHLELEDAMAKFTDTDGAIMYSDGASTVTSTITAFAKRGDLLVVDDGVYEPVVTGVKLSRANVLWFRHNDMDDLRRLLKEVERKDKRLGRKSNAQRRFIVIEGLYKNSGTVTPLDEVVALKHEFNYRLILDESHSFGTLGKTGRGVMEEYGKRHMYDAEIITISLENAIGSVGGVTVGNEEVVDHQRLSGAGYCFSASSPPFTASAAIQALEQMKTRPELLQRLNENKDYFHRQMQKELGDVIPDWLIMTSDERSPIIFLEVSNAAEGILKKGTISDEISFLEAIVQECINNGIAVVSTGRHVKRYVQTVPPPAIRMTVSASLSKEDIDKGVKVLRKSVLHVVKR